MPSERIVKNGSLVKADYTLSTEDGIVVDTSIGFEADNSGILDSEREYKPIEIKVGSYETIKGLEDSLIGMKNNESKTFVINPKDGFGERDKNKVKKVPKDLLKINHEPVVGQTIVLLHDNKTMLGIIKGVFKKEVIVDFNHPLAGKKLVCTIKVVKIYN
ncbi:MAG: FKBP-type peptidyl-prolyl cis-trans isomerase [Candidatus Woesearchaeota archaeon]